jgi:hypothetical protein
MTAPPTKADHLHVYRPITSTTAYSIPRYSILAELSRRWDIVFGGQFDQAQHSSPLHSTKSVHDVIFVEYSQQALHSLRCVTLPRLDELSKDAPGGLYGA